MSTSFLSAAATRDRDVQIISSPAPPTFLPLPVVDGNTLTYERFLREFALPRKPCIIRNVGRTWAARKWTVDYMLEHEGVDKEHKVYMADGPPESARESKRTVGNALRLVAKTATDVDWNPALAPGGEERSCYLSAWDYVRGNSGALQDDFEVPRFFARAPEWLASNVVLGNAQTDMKWLYIGSRGSGSATHVDTNLSSAWLWVARGEKEWVCAHGGDYQLLTAGTGARAYGYKGDDDSDDDDGSVPLPDFFAADLFDRWPQTRGARLYRGVQQAGDVCFNPSRCVHAVRNIGDHAGDIILSLTHNFVDATNLADALADATRALTDELLPLARSLKPRSAIKTLAKALKLSKEDVARVVVELPSLLTDARVEELIACAAAGAEGDEHSEHRAEELCAGPAAVAQLLRAELQRRLQTVRPAFESAALALRQVLQLDPAPIPP